MISINTVVESYRSSQTLPRKCHLNWLKENFNPELKNKPLFDVPLNEVGDLVADGLACIAFPNVSLCLVEATLWSVVEPAMYANEPSSNSTVYGAVDKASLTLPINTQP